MKYIFRTKPYRHQVYALRRFLRQKYLGVLWEPGTGKSKLVIDAACALNQMGKLNRVLIVCPLSVVGVWEEEWEKHATRPYNFHRLPKEVGYKPPTSSDLTVLVANYDRAWRYSKEVGKFKPELVVADESHRIKKPGTRRSWFMRSLRRSRYRMILTGTPTPKSFLDLYGQWTFLQPKTFGTNKAAFVARYIIFGGFMKTQVRGYTNVDELKAKVKVDATIRRKDQCLDLPSQVFQRVPVILEPEARSMYDKMAYELYLELKGGEVSDAKNVAVKILRLQQITGGWIKSDEGNVHQVSSAKVNAIRDLLEDLWDARERVVVFCRFIPEVLAVAACGTSSRVPTYVLRGATKPRDRDTDRHQFQSLRGPSLFVAQIATGGLGITLHSSAHAIFYSTSYALDEYIQACDRLHRIGQKRSVTYQHLVGVGTIDLDIYASHRMKRNILEQLMGKPETLIRHIDPDERH